MGLPFRMLTEGYEGVRITGDVAGGSLGRSKSSLAADVSATLALFFWLFRF
mgnify:CR=1 FL=1